jgi:hypothetical protein
LHVERIPEMGPPEVLFCASQTAELKQSLSVLH